MARRTKHESPPAPEVLGIPVVTHPDVPADTVLLMRTPIGTDTVPEDTYTMGPPEVGSIVAPVAEGPTDRTLFDVTEMESVIAERNTLAARVATLEREVTAGLDLAAGLRVAAEQMAEQVVALKAEKADLERDVAAGFGIESGLRLRIIELENNLRNAVSERESALRRTIADRYADFRAFDDGKVKVATWRGNLLVDPVTGATLGQVSALTPAPGAASAPWAPIVVNGTQQMAGKAMDEATARAWVVGVVGRPLV